MTSTSATSGGTKDAPSAIQPHATPHSGSSARSSINAWGQLWDGLAGISNEQLARVFYTCLAIHVVAWTIYASIAHGFGAVHDDMAEAWAWGKEFQLGYYKHPPFYSWIVGGWFKIFPRDNWSYFLLSALNAALGLAGAWALAGRFLTGLNRFAAVLLLTLTPFYNFLAINFNANSILLSLWPWTVYFFVRSIETGRLTHAVLLGGFSGFGLLSKYYSALLLVCCFGAALLHPARARYFRSPAPYVAVLVCGLVVAPHVWWTISNGAPTVQYAMARAQYSTAYVLSKAAQSGVSSMLYHGVALGVLFLALRERALPLLRQAWSRIWQPDHRWIAVLAFGPFILTLMAGFIGQMKISSNFTIPIFYLVPVVALLAAAADMSVARFQIIAMASAMVIVAPLLASPLVAYLSFATGRDIASQPRRELVAQAHRVWHEQIGTPVKLVAGTEPYSLALAFYSPDEPSELSHFNMDWSPWVVRSRIDQEGLLIACVKSDLQCFKQAGGFATADTRRVGVHAAKTMWGLTLPGTDFELILVPPRAIVRAVR